MGSYRVDTHIYSEISDDVADFLEASSEHISNKVAEQLSGIVLDRQDPTHGDNVFVYRYSTRLPFVDLSTKPDDATVAAVAAEVLDALQSQPPGTTIRPMRLAFVVPPDPKHPNALSETLPITAQIVWVHPPKE